MHTSCLLEAVFVFVIHRKIRIMNFTNFSPTEYCVKLYLCDVVCSCQVMLSSTAKLPLVWGVRGSTIETDHRAEANDIFTIHLRSLPCFITNMIDHCKFKNNNWYQFNKKSWPWIANFVENHGNHRIQSCLKAKTSEKFSNENELEYK